MNLTRNPMIDGVEEKIVFGHQRQQLLLRVFLPKLLSVQLMMMRILMTGDPGNLLEALQSCHRWKWIGLKTRETRMVRRFEVQLLVNRKLLQRQPKRLPVQRQERFLQQQLQETKVLSVKVYLTSGMRRTKRCVSFSLSFLLQSSNNCPTIL